MRLGAAEVGERQSSLPASALAFGAEGGNRESGVGISSRQRLGREHSGARDLAGSFPGLLLADQYPDVAAWGADGAAGW